MPPTFTRYRVTGSGDIRYNYEDELQICSITRLVTILSDKSQFVSYFPTKPPPQIRGPCVQVETKESLMIGKEWAGHWQEP